MLVISIAEEFSIIARRELVRLKLHYRTLKSIIGINVSYFRQMDFFFFCVCRKNCRDTYDVTCFVSDVDNSYESIT